MTEQCECGCGSDRTCLAEKLRYWRSEGGLQLDPKATPTKTRNSVAPAKANPAWERGIVTEKRRGGTEMPMLDQNMNPIHVRPYADNRSTFEAERRRLANTTTPLAT